ASGRGPALRLRPPRGFESQTVRPAGWRLALGCRCRPASVDPVQLRDVEARNGRDFDALVILQRMRRRRRAFGKWQPRKALPVSDRGIAPPMRFLLLPHERRRDLTIALWVDERLQRGPLPAHGGHLVNAAVVVRNKLVPETAA